jgi:hypothetical protein
MDRRIRNGMAGGVFAAMLICATAALAQQQGSTSGPAAGTNVEPSTAAQKKMMNKGAKAGSDNMKGDDQAGSMASGGAGVAAKQGSESGPTPVKKPNQ